MPERTLIFADLHEPDDNVIGRIEAVIADDKPDRVVFLGDYFDRFDDESVEGIRRTAEWLRESLCDPRRTHLFGNHDLPYFFRSDAASCPGWSVEKQSEFDRILGAEFAPQFAFFAMIDGWLLTHAGLAAKWVPEVVRDSSHHVGKWLDKESANARMSYFFGAGHWFSARGVERGGYCDAGGILWCDFCEKKWAGRQIFGHTPGHVPRAVGASICLDTNIGGKADWYALIEGGELVAKHLWNASTPAQVFDPIST